MQKGKICTKCNHWKFFNEFNKRSFGNKDGHRSDCKECQKIANAKYRGNNREKINKNSKQYHKKNPEIMREPAKRQRELYPEKIRARNATVNAIKRGELKRPDACECCSQKKDNIQAHHKSYSPEHYLNVDFLCIPCHRGVHERRVQCV